MKKILCLVLIVMLFASQSVFAFSDMPNDNTRTALENAVKNGLLSGYDGKIMPYDNLTRAQMAAIMSRALGAKKTADISGYSDVSASDWFYEDMAKAVFMGAFKGDGDKLNPENFITREEAFVVISRVFSVIDGYKNSILSLSDFDEISSWAYGAISGMIRDKYIEPEGNKIEPKRYITRAEFAVIMDKMVNYYISEGGVYETLPDGNVLIRAEGVYLKGIKTDKNIIAADGVGDSGIKLTDMNMSGKLIIRGGGKNVYIRGDFSEIHIVVPSLDVNAMNSNIEALKIVKGSNIYMGEEINGYSK